VTKVNKTSPAGEPATAQAHPSQRILVVEDDIGIRQLNVELLIACGYQVDAVEDGAAGWEALQAGSYDLLITDNNMPKLSGVELVKMVRSARMALPVILASGAIPPEELNLNLSGTLLKPFTAVQLLRTVKQSIARDYCSLPADRATANRASRVDGLCLR
jgi:CheY-like chemotaxis protein